VSLVCYYNYVNGLSMDQLYLMSLLNYNYIKRTFIDTKSRFERDPQCDVGFYPETTETKKNKKINHSK